MTTSVDAPRAAGSGWTGSLVRYVVFGVTVAAVLWVFSSIREHQDRIVRLEEREITSSSTLIEVRNDVKTLLRAESTRVGREEILHGRQDVRAGSSTSGLE